MRTPFTDLVGIEHPVVLAPMSAWSTGRLAAAVSAAGGLGLIGGGYAEPEWVEQELTAATGSRVGIGFITWALKQRPEVLEIALAHRPLAVTLAFGDPSAFAGRIKDAGALLICQVHDTVEARTAVAVGADVIIAQGSDGGGHVGSRGTLALIPAIVDLVHPTPVVAAGGIADGRGLAAALALGAGGVLVGTRFCATPEAAGPAAIKQRLIDASGDDTLATDVFDLVRDRAWPAHYTGRALRNDFSDRWHGMEQALLAALDEERVGFAESEATGDTDVIATFAGQGVDLIDSLVPVADLVAQLVEEADRALARASR